MRPVLLIAANFLREQRWLTLVLVAYAVGGAAVFGATEKHISAEDALFFFHQQSLYSVFFSFFLAVSAIHNERKSRRMLAVLAKGITRYQYLAGILCGILAVFGIYCMTIGIAGSWLVRNAQSSLTELWMLLGLTSVASLLVSAVALLFTTFMSPPLATVATALTVTLPAAVERTMGGGWGDVIPIYSLALQVSRATLAEHAAADWRPALIGIVEILLLWSLASWIFAGRDVSAAVE
jgi:hypothetical protein